MVIFVHKHKTTIDMKKLIFLSTIALLLSGCSISPEKKAASIIKESIQKTLIFPESYDPIETKLDSAFSPQNDPSFIQLVLDLNNKSFEYEALQAQIASAEREVSIWDTPYPSSYSKTQYKQAKEKYDSFTQELTQLTSRLQKMGSTISEQLYKPKEFIGYKAEHSYRAKNNAGEIMIGKDYYLFDKDLTIIEKTWTGEEITLYDQIIKKLMDVRE